MDPETLKLAMFAEALAVLAAKTVADLSKVIHGSHTMEVSAILDDADATYNDIIARAKG